MKAAVILVSVAAVGLALGLPAHAQSTVTRSETAAPGKPVRLVISPNLKKDCSTGPLPEMRIVTAPKNGTLVTKGGKIKTPASFRCPNKEAMAQAVFYTSKPDFSGTDEVLVEVKTADGTIEKQDIRITVDAAKKDDAKDKGKKDDGTSL